MSCFRPKTKDDEVGNGSAAKEQKSGAADGPDAAESNSKQTKEKKEVKAKSKSKENADDIEKKLKAEKKQHAMTHKIPVVGAGECGKSTLIKQMQILYLKGYDENARREKVPDIRRNIRDGMLSITGAMSNLNPPVELENPEYQQYVDYVQTETISKEFDYPPEFFERCCLLWKDKGVQEAFSRANEYQLIDSAKWFLDKCEEVGKPEYLPDEQDILRCRVLTSGIFETKFLVDKVMFHMFDVGGQRDERRKWIQVFHDITAVIFVSACSGYDSRLREDPTQNRLQESIDLFRTIWNNRYLRQNSVILFLNKQDTFQDKILKGKTKLEDYFEAFKSYPQPAPDPHCPDEQPELTRAKSFVRDQFQAIAQGDGQRRCYPHYTTAVDTENIRRVFSDCQNILRRVYMTQLNLL
ncbi:hypothetical protein BOX15_Mlig033727g1 [Macrostomum lignano]|uniref:Guanine nucleotide-binding protein G(s) subunit alpha n=1 Tax=Macrostomum lignano TaxID=282301 RepID=A0A267FGJ5_9PLAT|nr:hypothetical protein BOX15_Mlig033727g1 [Macrostomum lignano]